MDTFMEFLRNSGDLGLFIHSMLDAIIFPIPALFLQLSLSALQPEAALWLATVGFIGCMVGTPIGYGIGKASGKLLLSKIMKKEWLESATQLFRRHGEAAILIGSFTPIPFKIFTILSGFMKYPLWKLLIYAAFGRAVKFYAIGALFYIYGRAAEKMVNHMFGIIILGVGILIAAIWFIIRKLHLRRKNRKIIESVESNQSAEGVEKHAVDQKNGSNDVPLV